MLYSCFATQKEDFICSVDMIRLTFELRESCVAEFMSHFNDFNRSDIYSYRPNFTDLKYRYLFKIDCKYSSCIIGFSFNGFKASDKFIGFIEFNPNKVFEEIIEDLHFIKLISLDFNIKRADIAFDFNVSRDKVKLFRDISSCYRLEYKSSNNFTEYLGSRNTNNFIKIYNKSFEAGLDVDVTRFEVTLDFPFKHFTCPEIYIIDSLVLFDDSINDTDFVLLSLILKSDNPTFYLSKLGRGKRIKYKKYFDSFFQKLFKDDDFIRSCLFELNVDLTDFFLSGIIQDVAKQKTLRKTLDFTK